LIAAKRAEYAPAMELGFNEMFRMLQIEKAMRLCTAPRASVHSYQIYRQNSRKNVRLFRFNYVGSCCSNVAHSDL